MTTKITEKNVSNLANAAVQWQNIITADGSTNTNLESGKGYFIDTTSNTHTVVLPSNPTAGDTIVIRDYALTFDDNKRFLLIEMVKKLKVLRLTLLLYQLKVSQQH